MRLPKRIEYTVTEVKKGDPFTAFSDALTRIGWNSKCSKFCKDTAKKAKRALNSSGSEYECCRQAFDIIEASHTCRDEIWKHVPPEILTLLDKHFAIPF